MTPMTDQPAPTNGIGDMWSELLELLPAECEPLRAEFEQRRALGLQRYGTTLGRDDGRDAIRDLREELLDAAAYAQRLAPPGQPHWVAVNVMAMLMVLDAE